MNVAPANNSPVLRLCIMPTNGHIALKHNAALKGLKEFEGYYHTEALLKYSFSVADVTSVRILQHKGSLDLTTQQLVRLTITPGCTTVA